MSESKKMKPGPQRKLSDSGRKRNKKVVNAKINKSRIYIGNEYDRWMEIKTALRLETNSEVAKILLDRYAVTAACLESLPIRTPAKVATVCATPRGAAYVSTPAQCATPCGAAYVSTPAQCATPCGAAYVSTPAHSAWKMFSAHLSDVSGMSSEHEQVERRDDPCMSGIEEIGLEKSPLRKSCSFINPFNLTMNNSEKNFIGDWNEDDDSASDYQPSLDATLRQDHNIRIDLDSDDEDIDIDIEKGDSIADEPAVELGPNISRIKTDNDLTALLEDRTFLVFLNQILVLAKMKVENCAVVGCHEEVVISTEVISSALYLKWTCKNNHLVNKWCSQPVLNRRLHSGDLLFSSALLISGCNFQKISLFARFLKLAIPLSVSYLKMQRTYLAPTLDEILEKEQNQVFLEFKDKELVLLGDGRMDSPGHCAQYCTYTFMEMDTKKIVCIVTMDKRMTDKKSTNLEKACFLKGLQFLLGKGLKIAEIVTDAHVQVEALMTKSATNKSNILASSIGILIPYSPYTTAWYNPPIAGPQISMYPKNILPVGSMAMTPVEVVIFRLCQKIIRYRIASSKQVHLEHIAGNPRNKEYYLLLNVFLKKIHILYHKYYTNSVSNKKCQTNYNEGFTAKEKETGKKNCKSYNADRFCNKNSMTTEMTLTKRKLHEQHRP
ncbi:unnamed protein product [Mytilus coruscus]|uniref:Uncharacterized protein n=1 Tax=Mytilus coruscus TaxID=42192 RepID=A0A6J8E4E6_MYTCO|nr:unnamed protein product [Mytilus coruscus]